MIAGSFQETSRLLPSTVKNAIGQPPLCDLIKVTGKGPVVRFIEFELIKLSKLVSVGGNLNSAQVEFIATQMVEFFPNESLADFKICFERGCMGQYGEIFRMDGIVLRKWMEQYLDEKYTIVEENLVKEKDNLYAPSEPPKETGKGYAEFQEWAKTLQKQTSVRPIFEGDAKREGKEEAPARQSATRGYAYFTVNEGKNQILASSQDHANELFEKYKKTLKVGK